MSTVYLAGSSAEATRVQRWAMTLERAGLEHTSRWWEDCESWAGKDAFLTREQQWDIATMHLAEIARAAIVWVLSPRSLSGGAMVEMGAAISLAAHTPGRYVVVSGPGHARMLFSARADFRDESDEVAFTAVCARAREAGRT